jgi:hypothetical protein
MSLQLGRAYKGVGESVGPHSEWQWQVGVSGRRFTGCVNGRLGRGKDGLNGAHSGDGHS